MTANDYDLTLEDLARSSTMRLLASESFDLPAFTALYDYLSDKAEALKSEHMISKQILAALRDASQVIRNQAPHVAAARENISVADKFEGLLDLMVMSESPRDRTPGVPRII